MILVDSSVWIDHIAGRETIQTLRLQAFLVRQQGVGVGDLVMAEVLQGTRNDKAFHAAREQLAEFPCIQISDFRIAEQAARHYRTLRARGISIRKTIDTLIATRCIADNLPLLYADRDFDPFVRHLGLRSALDDTGVT